MHPSFNSPHISFVGLALAALVVSLLALTVYFVRLPRQSSSGSASSKRRKARQMPRQWPLNPRPVANSTERRVWQWLHATFPHHHVVPKLPLTRFTMPRDPNDGNQWFDMLSSAYCSFTICDDQARVVGCVDVLGPRGLSRSNRQLKQTLLAQCGIGYWVLSADSLPAAEAIRAEFLGVAHPDTQHAAQSSTRAELETVRNQLHEMLDRNRERRYLRTSSVPLDTDDVTPWPQADSFLGTLDSRSGALLPH
jgi:hypothetical protein